MKRLRFLLAIVLDVVLLAQAGALGGLAACVQARDAVVRAASVDVQASDAPIVAHAHHGGDAAPAEPVSERPLHHRVPASGDRSHCVTSPGCAAAALASVDVELVPATFGGDDGHDVVVSAPRSVHRTPEPPPPRA